MISPQTVVIAAALFISAYILLWCFIRPVKFCVKVAVKSVLGYFALFLCNQMLAPLGFCVGLNVVTSLICGFLGINGFLLLTAVNYFIR